VEVEMVVGADVSESGSGVGCFDPEQVLLRLREAFGPDVEYDLTDLLAGVQERVLRTATELGMPADSLPVRSAARAERTDGPRYQFRLRVGPGAFVTGRVDRYSVQVACEAAAEFPEPARGRFVAFLRSLRLGRVVRYGCGPDAEPSAADRGSMS
jgi:hypothetical protein